MPHYIVTWKHGIDAETPASAANAALALMRLEGPRVSFDVFGEFPHFGHWRVSEGMSVDLENLKPPVADLKEIPVVLRTKV